MIPIERKTAGRNEKKATLKKEGGRRRFPSIVLVFVALWSLSGVFPASPPLFASTDPQPLQMTAHLYFATTDHTFLTAEERILPRENDPAEVGKSIVEALIEGPKRDLMRTLPKETVLKSVYVTEEGTAYVDFSDAIRKHHPGGVRMETVSIYSIVNSLILNIDRIKAVKLLIGGREAQTLAGHIDSRFPFSANMLIIR
ncbi:MAG: GerMN domain-containing protein [Pseudomonadota bacterium]